MHFTQIPSNSDSPYDTSHSTICFGKASLSAELVESLTLSAVRGTEYGRGIGKKAKEAEESASRQALTRLCKHICIPNALESLMIFISADEEDPEGVEGTLQYFPRLERHLATCGLTDRVDWDFQRNGPDHNIAWTCNFLGTYPRLQFLSTYCFTLNPVDTLFFAKGEGTDKKQAKEIAARNAASLWIEAMQQ